MPAWTGTESWDDQGDGDAERWGWRWYVVDSCRRRKTVRRRRFDEQWRRCDEQRKKKWTEASIKGDRKKEPPSPSYSPSPYHRRRCKSANIEHHSYSDSVPKISSNIFE